MYPNFAERRRQFKFPGTGVTECLAILMFIFCFLPSAFATGAGKSNVPCQGTTISPTDDIVGIINNGQPNQTFCIEGEHRITTTIQLLSGQSLIGTTSNARISGAVVLSPWQPTSTQGVYYYDGSYANIQPHQQKQYSSGSSNVCYWVSTYLDDLFFQTNSSGEQRVMRVLSQEEVDPTKPVTTQGQAITAGEAGRFFFDYANHRIYVSLPNNQDPNTVSVDLAINLNHPHDEAILFGPGQTNVTLQNLFVEKGMNYGIYAGEGWTLKDVTVQFIHNVGVYSMVGAAGQPATVDDALFTNNGRLGFHSGSASDLTMTNSEMSWNNIANFRPTDGQTGSGACLKGYKDAGAFHIFHNIGTPSQTAVSIDNLWSHDNVADGLWSDGGSQYTQITNSTLSGNERFGYVHEISCQVVFSGNTIYDNGYSLKNPDISGGGVEVSDSNFNTFTSNTIYNNYPGFAFHLTLQAVHGDMKMNKCLHAKHSYDTGHTLKYNQVVSNSIYECSGEASIGKVWGAGGPLNKRHNTYQSNNYFLADSSSEWFADGDRQGHYLLEDWTTWQQEAHDTQGSITIGCHKGESLPTNQ